jgi:hypothetical protein
MERGSIGESKNSTRWPCTLAEGKEPWTVSRWFHSNSLSLQCCDVFLCNTCCRYSMLNGIVDSRKVRAQKAASLSQSIGGSSFIPSCSEEWQEVKMLKETLRQRDEEMRQLDEEQRQRDKIQRQQYNAMRQRDDFYAQAFAQQQIIL